MRKFLVAALSTVIVVVTLAVVTAVWDRNASDKRAQSARQAIESVIPADLSLIHISEPTRPY